jgi:hypothetical protein
MDTASRLVRRAAQILLVSELEPRAAVEIAARGIHSPPRCREVAALRLTAATRARLRSYAGNDGVPANG